MKRDTWRHSPYNVSNHEPWGSSPSWSPCASSQYCQFGVYPSGPFYKHLSAYFCNHRNIQHRGVSSSPATVHKNRPLSTLSPKYIYTAMTQESWPWTCIPASPPAGPAGHVQGCCLWCCGWGPQVGGKDKESLREQMSKHNKVNRWIIKI